MITNEQVNFLINEGYLLIDTIQLEHDEFIEAELELNNIIENKKFNTLVFNPVGSISDDTISLFPDIVRAKDDEWTGPQDELIKFHDYIIDNIIDNLKTQIWFYTQSRNLFINLKKIIANDVYNISPDEYDGRTLAEFTLYIPGSKTPLHQDGCESGRHCVILTYFSKDYQGNGGIFKFTDTHGNIIEIEPEYGKSLILDFTNKKGEARNNLFHEVTEVKNNFYRYTYLDSINESNWKI